MKAAEFVQRNKFLVGVGALVLAGLAACAGLFVPARMSNAAEESRLVGKAQSLSQYAAKKIYSENDIPEAQKLAAAYQAVLDDLRKGLEEADKPLEEALREPDALPDAAPLEGSIWKLVYDREVEDLADKLEEEFLVVGADPIVAISYGDEIPTAEEMAEQTRYFRIQQAAVDAVAKVNGPANPHAVPVFRGFSFLAAPERLLSPVHGQEFTPIPFEIRLSADFTSVPRVLYNLLESPARFQITTISIERPQRLDRGKQVAVRSMRTRPAVPPTQRAKPAATTVAARTRAPSVTVRGGAGSPGYRGPSAEEIKRMTDEAEAMAREQAELMLKLMGGAAGPPAGFVPPMAGGYGPPTGSGAPSAVRPRRGGLRTTKGTELTEEIKAMLPKTLVDVTIRGYVADYKGSET